MCTVGMKVKTARVEVRLELLASPRADRVEDLLAWPAYTAEGRPRNDSEQTVEPRAQHSAVSGPGGRLSLACSSRESDLLLSSRFSRLDFLRSFRKLHLAEALPRSLFCPSVVSSLVHARPEIGHRENWIDRDPRKAVASLSSLDTRSEEESLLLCWWCVLDSSAKRTRPSVALPEERAYLLCLLCLSCRSTHTSIPSFRPTFGQ